MRIMEIDETKEPIAKSSGYSEKESIKHLISTVAKDLRTMRKSHPQSLSERDIRHIKESIDE